MRRSAKLSIYDVISSNDFSRIMQTFFLIIIDQLGWQDRERLDAVTRRLDCEPQLLVNEYMPTVTETAHATLSTGCFPNEHHVIGGEGLTRCANGQLGLRQVRSNIFQARGYGTGEPFTHALASLGIRCFVVSGKEKVAHLLAPGQHPQNNIIKLWLEKAPQRPLRWRTVNGLDRSALPDVSMLDSLHHPDVDAVLFDAAERLLTLREAGEKHLILLALPRTDIAGHWNRRDSDTMKDGFNVLNERLKKFLDSYLRDDDACVITGDHGWRSVDSAVWPDGDYLRTVDSDGIRGDSPLPAEVAKYLYKNKHHRSIICDGGTMRIWTEVSKERNVANWLGSDLGRFFDAIEYGETLESSLMKRQSSSPNWGLVVAFARANVAICKKDWLHWTAENEPLVPIVEHGTYFRDDTNVPLWSRLPNSAPVTSHASIADCLRKWALSPK